MQPIELRLLGPVEVLVEGRALELKRRQQRSLLALLALHAGEVLSRDRLIDELWAGNAPRTAVGSLQNSVSELRKAIGRDTLRTREPGYVLDVDVDAVDSRRFERLVAEAAEGGDPARRASLLRQALDLWRGSPLGDLEFEPFAHVEVARLEELRTTAREELIQAELELGRHAHVLTDLEALVAKNPLRERLRGQLMLALYRSGRQADALDVYRQTRETLIEELGIEPSRELQELERSILRHDEELNVAADIPVPTTTPPARRKTVTVLLADIVDSATLAATLDPEVLRDLMRRYFDTVRTIVERHGGTVERFSGDAAIALFGIPELHEDDALRAVRAERDLRVALGVLNTDLEQSRGLALQVKIGINTGEALAGGSDSGEPSATGAAVTDANRLLEAALPGETLLGGVTQDLVRDDVDSEPAGPLEPSGFLPAIQAFRLLGADERAGFRRPFRSTFVGRDAELETLQAAFDSVVADRRSRLVVLLGEAGVGKSRLTAEFASRLGEDARVVIGRCVSYGDGATLLPIAEIVRQVAPERPETTVAALVAPDEHGPAVALRIAELAAGESTAPTGELFWAVRRFLEALGSERPVVVVFEDAHWAQPTLLDLIEYLGAWRSESPLLVIVTARPDLLEQRPGWRSGTETIPLRALSTDESGDLLEQLAGETDLPPATRARIVRTAEGNPLFVEQLLAYVVDHADDEVPPTIEALLASRLDSIDGEERAVLERAAVIGKDFSRAAVLHLSPPETLAALDRHLGVLVRKAFIDEPPRGAAPDSEFRFHHVLIRDVTYAAVTKKTRGDLHERHAVWLENRGEADELVGYHAEQAHRYRLELDPRDPAVARLASWGGDRLAAAGIRAWKRADTPATVNLLRRAVDLLPSDSPQRVELLCELGSAQKGAGDFGLAEATLVEARDAAPPRDRHLEQRAEIELAHLRLFTEQRGAAGRLEELADRAIPLFEELGDERALARTWRHLGYVRGMQGRLADWLDAAERALEHYVESGWSGSGCLAEIASALFYGPTPADDARLRCEQLLAEATERIGRANVLTFLGGLESLEGRFGDARARVAEAAAIYEETGERYQLANNSGRILARIEMLAGEVRAAERALADCCELFDRLHDEAALSTVAAELGDALYLQGRDGEAAAWVDLARARAAAEDVSAQYTWRRVRAKLSARAGSYDEARALVGEAVAIAAATDALDDHGQVRLDAAEVLRISGRSGEAAREIEAAIRLFEEKGDRISLDRARVALTDLTVA